MHALPSRPHPLYLSVLLASAMHFHNARGSTNAILHTSTLCTLRPDSISIVVNPGLGGQKAPNVSIVEPLVTPTVQIIATRQFVAQADPRFGLGDIHTEFRTNRPRMKC
jgi:hypothetical protein